MKKYNYKTSGTCSKEIFFDVDDEMHIHNVRFIGGCNGNLQGIGRLVEGMPVDEVEAKLNGIKCGVKLTSCPDQLANAVRKVIGEK
jgi:uncharacterized protein (TIGR03905 family)